MAKGNSYNIAIVKFQMEIHQPRNFGAYTEECMPKQNVKSHHDVFNSS